MIKLNELFCISGKVKWILFVHVLTVDVDELFVLRYDAILKSEKSYKADENKFYVNSVDYI